MTHGKQSPNLPPPYSAHSAPHQAHHEYPVTPADPRSSINSMALGAMVTGIICLPLFAATVIVLILIGQPYGSGFFGIIGLIPLALGTSALKQIKFTGKRGKGMAITGIVTGIISLIPAVLTALALLYLAAKIIYYIATG